MPLHWDDAFITIHHNFNSVTLTPNPTPNPPPQWDIFITIFIGAALSLALLVAHEWLEEMSATIKLQAAMRGQLTRVKVRLGKTSPAEIAQPKQGTAEQDTEGGMSAVDSIGKCLLMSSVVFEVVQMAIPLCRSPQPQPQPQFRPQPQPQPQP